MCVLCESICAHRLALLSAPVLKELIGKFPGDFSVSKLRLELLLYVSQSSNISSALPLDEVTRSTAWIPFEPECVRSEQSKNMVIPN